MNRQFIYFFAIFMPLYGIINYYVGLRFRQALGVFIPSLPRIYYWPLFTVIAMSYLGGAGARRFFPETLSTGLLLVGSYWLAVLQYAFFVFLLFDLIRLLDRWSGFLPQSVKQNPAITATAALSLIAAIVIYGYWNARSPQFTHYDVTVHKPAGGLKHLHVLMVPDIHLSKIVHNGRLARLVQMINEKEPDLILLPGDIIEEINVFQEQKMGDTLRQLKARFGVYAVPGNHEYYGGPPGDIFALLQEAGVTVLRDSYVRVDDNFTIVGRDDRTAARFTGQSRQALSAIMDDVDKSLPIILMDHQPYNLQEGQANGVDLQVSGHTHQGQVFPLNFVTKRIFEIDWGHLQKGETNIIVSTGFGTWGPPIRIGNTPEVVDIVIHFNHP